MKFVVLAVVALSISGSAIAQRRPGQYWSLGGYGNILFPGTGHAPTTPPGGVTGPHFSKWIVPLRRATEVQPSIVIVPSPVYDEGYTADPSGSDQPGDPGPASGPEPSPAPPVIINQSLVPPQRPAQPGAFDPKDGAVTGVNPQCNVVRPQAPEEDRPTIYLIAFKDHSIVQALGYWLDGGTLHYVSAEYGLNQASIVLIDRSLSQRLNAERGVAFKLSAAK